MMSLFIAKALFNGQCPDCAEPTCGTFDSDENMDDGEVDGVYWVKMECVNCHKKTKVHLDNAETGVYDVAEWYEPKRKPQAGE